MNLSNDEKKILINTARKSIESKFDNSVSLPVIDYENHPMLKGKGGAFVTLTIHGELRGCIGYIISDQKLPETVTNAAREAAFGDPRFPPITKKEFPSISVEISILSEPFPMKNYDEIELGKHVLILGENGRRGLLLPQVPVEHDMNKEQYLDAICRKAGVPQTLWKEKKLNIELFTATVFSENDLED